MRRWFSGFLLIYDLFFIHIISDDELEELSLRGRGGGRTGGVRLQLNRFSQNRYMFIDEVGFPLPILLYVLSTM